MTTFAIQAGALRTNPSSGPDGIGVQADIAYTLEARSEVQAVCATIDKVVKAHAEEPTASDAKGGRVNLEAANDNGLTFFSVCSGIEAASVAWNPLGWKAAGFAEIDPAAALVLHRHYNASRPLFMPNPAEPGLKKKDKRDRMAAIKATLKMPADGDITNWGDFTRVDVSKVGRVDILCGGTPCQAFSVAGARKSLADARGNLSLAFVELAHDLAANNGLRNAVWENVPGVLNTKDNAFGCFLAGIVGADDALPPPRPRKWPNAGMVAGPLGRAAWCVLDAQHFGLAQRRKRVIVVADFGNGADPAAVLFERLGLPGYSPARGEAREGVAPTISARTQGGGGLGTDFDLDGGLQIAQPLLAKANSSHDDSKETYVPTLARCDATREGSSQDYESTTMVAVGVHGAISHTLKAEGADASEDGTGRGTPIVAFNPRATDVPVYGEQSGALDASYPGPAIAFTAKDYGADAQEDIASTLRAGGHRDSHQNGGVGPAVAFQSSQSGVRVDDVHATLDSNNGSRRHNGAIVGSAVRRLTPRECERLQGFPDDYTRIPVRKAPKKVTRPRPDDMWECIEGEWWLMAADGPRYKQLGNSWAVPKFRWLGERIAKHMPPRVEADNDNQSSSQLLPSIAAISAKASHA